MVKIDEQFIKEKINPVVGFIFNTARQLGADNAPDSMDMEYLRQGTEKVRALIEETAAEELSAFVRNVKRMVGSDNLTPQEIATVLQSVLKERGGRG